MKKQMGACALEYPMQYINTKLNYIVMPKIDGVRFRIGDSGELLSRSNKPVPNKQLNVAMMGMPAGVEGEFVYGNILGENFDATSQIVRKSDANIDGITVVLFDWDEPNSRLDYQTRLENVSKLEGQMGGLSIVTVPYRVITGAEVIALTRKTTWNPGPNLASAEGSMIRSADGFYKYGKATLREGTFFKIKHFFDDEGVVVGYERMQVNQNEAFIDETGAQKRSTHKDGMVEVDTIGKLIVQYKGFEFGLGSGLNDMSRAELWDNRDNLKGKLVKFKYYGLTNKGKPRLPIYLGLRDEFDLDTNCYNK